MTEEHIDDGEIHALETNFGLNQAYILKKLDRNLEMVVGGEFDDLKYEWLEKVARYIFECNKDKFFEILLEHCDNEELINLMVRTLSGHYSRVGLSPINHSILNMEMIYRPAHMISLLAMHATLALKFDRVPGDEEWFKKNQSGS